MAAPIHNNGGRKADKLIGDALRVAAKRVQEGDPQGRTKLAIAAEKVVEAAVEGDLAAFKEMADRIDGKAVQQMDVTTTERAVSDMTDDELTLIIRSAKEKIAPAKPAGKSH